MANLTEGTYPVNFAQYIKLVEETNVPDALRAQEFIINDYFEGLASKADYAYAPGKWTLKEMLQHIIDTERIFNFRALCFARKEMANIPGFDEDAYAANSHAHTRSWESLCAELKVVRKSTRFLFESFNVQDLDHSGTANGKSVTVAALGFITVGHIYHHVNVIKERYLNT
ncbi:MAG: DinB family protein [Chitinophagaceae bacterium]|nr:MAG: DinB family protein [Chitinophagaceae bacterium]